MSTGKASRSQQIRARLNHPIIDSDGHYVEVTPLLEDYIRDAGGAGTVQWLKSRKPRFANWYAETEQQRRESWSAAPAWWFVTQDPLDRATASLPKLLYERMDELGLDLTVLFPSNTMSFMSLPDPGELRQVLCRASNTYLADMYRDYGDRMIPMALIPTTTPKEAIAELDHAVRVLGHKAVVISSYAHRSVNWSTSDLAEEPFNGRPDYLALDSEYDYDPVWAKCLELGVPVTAHSPLHGFGVNRSTSTYMYNHLGQLASSGQAFCKALFFGGVTRRFPQLKFAFMECGVGWACALYSGILGNWEKRNAAVIEHLNPANLDLDMVMELVDKYSDPLIAAKGNTLREYFGTATMAPAMRDDWYRCGIEKLEDIRDLFVPNFYFGCEADDPINAWAFNSKLNPFGARLNALFGSDIGHWDVPNMRDVVAEAYELVEAGHITEDDLRDFVFANPIRFFAATNPNFFKGTAVEAAAAKLLKDSSIKP